MDVFFSTVVRHQPVAQGGELVRIDWPSGRLLASRPLVPPAPDVDDVRGNARGGRGVVRRGEILEVATYHSVLRFDFDLAPLGVITNQLMAGLHEGAADGDATWWAATAIDAAVKTGPKGEVLRSWWPRSEPILRERFGLAPIDIDLESDNRTRWLVGPEQHGANHTHLNAVALHAGRVFVLLNRQGIVYDVSASRILVEDARLRGGHNLVFADDRILAVDTRGRRILTFDLEGGAVGELDVLRFPEIETIRRRAEASATASTRSIFLRGLAALDGDRVLVGCSPATIFEIDLERQRLVGLYQHDADVAVCVHGLAVCPSRGEPGPDAPREEPRP